MPSLRDEYERYLQNPELLESEAEEAVVIRESDLSSEMGNHPGKFLKWAYLSAIAEGEASVAEEHLKNFVLPNCSMRVRQQLIEKGERTSEDRIAESAKLDGAYQQALSQMLKAKKIAGVFKRIESAMWHRKEMIQSMNYRHGRELSSFPKETY